MDLGGPKMLNNDVRHLMAVAVDRPVGKKPALSEL